jgi:sigma-B regulation protein RsbU (phosphoserine phosphatase)
MVERFGRHLRYQWRRFPWPDRIALLVALLAGLGWLTGLAGWHRRSTGGLMFGFLLALSFLAFRWFKRNRGRLLWSLRNRLVVAYLLIAVVPVILLLVMAGLSAYLIYSQYGAHLFYADLERQIERVSATADALAMALSSQAGDRGATTETLPVGVFLEGLREKLPGIEVRLAPEHNLLERFGNPPGERFAGIVQSGDRAWIEAVAAHHSPRGQLVVSVSVPLTPTLLDALAEDLGPIQLTLTQPVDDPARKDALPEFAGQSYVPVGQVASRNRSLAPARNWIDLEIKGFTNLEAIVLGEPGTPDQRNPIFVAFAARPSQMNDRLFSSLGAFGDVAYRILVLAGIVFLMIEAVALFTGIRLTRSITGAVAELYEATRHIRTGKFDHRVRITTRDQLGVLGESFNEMTSSISTLIESQRQSQRLENEVAIAREVQEQLFPQELPQIPGVELAAICHAARMVSGDYYDFACVPPNRLALVIADISGKGISAALLMASLQAAVRSQLQANGDGPISTAAIVSRLNKHLFWNTSEERYATFFFGVYDPATRILTYTNAGHLPPVVLVGERVETLETGGMVVGLFDECPYEEGTIRMEAGSLLVAYSDGLIEPENAYGEEFGTRRFIEEIRRHARMDPARLAEELVTTVEEWAGLPEQSDDMTVIVARMN